MRDSAIRRSHGRPGWPRARWALRWPAPADGWLRHMKQRRHAMSHIDEGRLAAYLDGELPAGSGELVEIELHVAACADCRKLLEEGLKHRNRARAILRSGAPSATEVPAFDEILRRAGKNA